MQSPPSSRSPDGSQISNIHAPSTRPNSQRGGAGEQVADAARLSNETDGQPEVSAPSSPNANVELDGDGAVRISSDLGDDDEQEQDGEGILRNTSDPGQ